jgi:hypothetical protein
MTALSLMVCLATIFLWALSHSELLLIKWEHGTEYSIASICNGYYISILTYPAAAAPLDDTVFWSMRMGWCETELPSPFRPWQGVRWLTIPYYNGASLDHSIIISYWLIILLTGIVPVAWLVRFRRRASWSWRLGLCRACGYDLRATPDRCPECGNVPKASAKPQPKNA